MKLKMSLFMLLVLLTGFCLAVLLSKNYRNDVNAFSCSGNYISMNSHAIVNIRMRLTFMKGIAESVMDGTLSDHAQHDKKYIRVSSQFRYTIQTSHYILTNQYVSFLPGNETDKDSLKGLIPSFLLESGSVSNIKIQSYRDNIYILSNVNFPVLYCEAE